MKNGMPRSALFSFSILVALLKEKKKKSHSVTALPYVPCNSSVFL